MNLWHQRVIIFSMKVFGVLCGLVFLGYFLYYNLYFKTDSLIKYVPKEAVGYATFRLTPELTQNQLVNKFLTRLAAEYNLPQLNLNDLNQLVGNNLSIALVPQQNNDARLDVLILADLGVRAQNLLQYQQWAQQNNWPSTVFSNQTKSKNILAIATSSDLLEQVRQIAVKQEPALSQKIDVVFNLRKFEPADFFGKIFIDKAFFRAMGLSFNQPQYKAFLNLANINGQPIFAGFNFYEDGIYIQKNPEPVSNLAASQFSENWPEDFIYALSFSDLAGGWQKAIDNLKQTDLDTYSKLLDNKEYFEGLLNFSWDNDLLPLLSGQVEVFSAAGNKYLIATTLKNDNLDNQTNQIETIIKRYIANSYPVEKQRQLPDNTYITSIVRDIDSLKFNEDEIMGFKIRGILKGDKEYIYILANNHLILANSRDIITSLLDNDQKINNWKNNGTIYNSSNFSEKVWLNLQLMPINNRILSTFKQISFYEDKATRDFMLILK